MSTIATTTIKKFDATDSKFQLKAEFKPDKENLWPYPKEEDGWVHAHNALRFEIREMILAVEATKKRSSKLQQWEIDCIAKAWKAHEEHIHSHHSNEDHIMAPFLSTRFHYPDKYTADHYDLVLKLNNLHKIVGDLKAGASGSATLLKELLEYEAMIKPHLLQEEIECLPLCRAYFTPEEVGEKVQEMIAKSPKVETGSFIHAMGVEKFRKKFMQQEKIPFFVWYVVFVWRLKHFRRVFVAPIEALKAGVKMYCTSNGSAWCNFGYQ